VRFNCALALESDGCGNSDIDVVSRAQILLPMILPRPWSAAFSGDFTSGCAGKDFGSNCRQMSRTPRQNILGGTYHVMNRGNRKMTIFEDDRDRRSFIRILIEEKQRYGVDVLADNQMRNHFHLIVGTPHGNLSDFMEQLEGRFARYSNWRHGRVGHLFQGRFRDVVIENDIHLLTALCYVFLNPLSARLVTRLEDYKWSTYAATVGLAPLPNYVSIDWLTALFESDSLRASQRRFRDLMSEAQPVLAYLRQGMTGVDPESVKRVLRSYVGEQLQLGMLPRTYRSALRSKLPELIQGGMPLPERAAAIHEAHVVHGYTLSEIARELGLHQSTVSKIFRAISRSRAS
jgi:putative transposase